jgi:Transposase DNA-binding/Transposase Tn5 dimerisation domain
MHDERDGAEFWAASEFGHAALGDPRRTSRLVSMAGQLAIQPAGRITQAFAHPAAREAAYRFIENGRISAEAIRDASRQAAARRAAAYSEVIVPIDGVAFAVADRSKRFGPLGTKYQAKGALGMSGLALSPDGVPLGLLGQVYWLRSQRRSPQYNQDKRPVVQRETGHWLTVLSQASEALRRDAPSTNPWFQLDRGGDCADVLLHALELGGDFTVRACYDRVVTGGKLWAKAASGKYLGSYLLRVKKPGSVPRIATIEVRARLVELHLRPSPVKRNNVAYPSLWVVEARERGKRKDRVRWRLLTTKPAATFEQARAVINAYTWRWRIEELHLTWKSGACGIEQSWLRTPERFFKWATITVAVAVRLERIKLLSRTQPDLGALEEFSRDEIDAAITLRKPKGISLGATPTLGEMVRWVADIGGYTGKSSGGPPGIRVITRGFERIEPAALAISRLRNDPAFRG